MATTNPVKTVTVISNPLKILEGKKLFVIDETETGVYVNTQANGLGVAYFLSHTSEGWEFDEDYEHEQTGIEDAQGRYRQVVNGQLQPPETAKTFDRPEIINFLVDSLIYWPMHQIQNGLPRLPEDSNWVWTTNYPSDHWLAVNSVTLETVSYDDWERAHSEEIARKDAEDEARHDVGTCPFDTSKHGPFRTGGYAGETKVHQTIDPFAVNSALKTIDDVPGYESLRDVLEAAYDQAARGKGKERHAQDLPFHEQRMQSISRLIGSERGMAYQVCKKVTEGMDLSTPEARRRELLGAINYIAGILIYWDQAEQGDSNDD